MVERPLDIEVNCKYTKQAAVDIMRECLITGMIIGKRDGQDRQREKIADD